VSAQPEDQRQTPDDRHECEIARPVVSIQEAGIVRTAAETGQEREGDKGQQDRERRRRRDVPPPGCWHDPTDAHSHDDNEWDRDQVHDQRAAQPPAAHPENGRCALEEDLEHLDAAVCDGQGPQEKERCLHSAQSSGS
jgi:hypothetical protein